MVPRHNIETVGLSIAIRVNLVQTEKHVPTTIYNVCLFRMELFVFLLVVGVPSTSMIVRGMYVSTVMAHDGSVLLVVWLLLLLL